ncbi:glycogen synthase GlgA [Desulfuromonas carbonis]|uniref:glycogen synthase GlgA n=1 Tax=Desulfuromonas sp. DDH964 TaxID=1823759 RepID=UPI00078BAD4C|nr:glycogen synthase GlgA [Desulfuromonas sp. DDH964]AMV73526.1 glycogen synthase [Desulfuromonas sp. DDH964]
MRILLVTPEVAPLAKTGGLADVAGSFPRELRRRGHDVRIILPYYRVTREQRIPLAAASWPVTAVVGGQLRHGLVRETLINDVPVYLIEHEDYFDRPQLYGTTDGDYPDNAERFGFFCRAVLDFIRHGPFRPEVLHLNDWQTGLIPVLLRHELATDPFYAGIGTLLTIHNLGYQGLFPRRELATLGLPEHLFGLDGVEFYGQVSLLKGGLLCADILTTVSPTYCREIQKAEQGHGFDGILRQRRRDLYGILNGLDPEQWDPLNDPVLPAGYSADDLRGKARCKRLLQQELGLEVDAKQPLVAIVSRLDPQKGLDLVEAAWDKLLARNLQLVLLGSGERGLMERFAARDAASAGQAAVRLQFDDALARRIYGGSDLFLMPSRYEPCGLGQLIALRYGSVPLVRRTGGLADTVTDIDRDPRHGNGFSFGKLSEVALLAALDRALQRFQGRRDWLRLVRQGMRADLSWRPAAQRYLELYNKAKERRGG